MKTKKILFVCKYNRFRSQIAEQLFKKYNKNKNIKAISAGVFEGLYPVDEFQKKMARTAGINIGKKPEAIKVKVFKDVDIVIIVANDVPRNLFLYQGRYLQKVVKWNIKDEYFSNEKNVLKIIGKIDTNVRKLVKQLEAEK